MVLHDFRYFRAVTEELSLSKGARHLHITDSPLSRNWIAPGPIHPGPGRRPGPARHRVRPRPLRIRRADKAGTIVIDSHAYLAGPTYHDRLLTAAIRHNQISILDEHGHAGIDFDRAWGPETTTILAPETLIPGLMAKPGAWSNSPARTHIPDPVRHWCDQATNTDRSDFFARLDSTVQATSFEAAIAAADRLIRANDDPAGPALPMLARRLDQGSEPAATNADLSVYNRFTTPQEATA